MASDEIFYLHRERKGTGNDLTVIKFQIREIFGWIPTDVIPKAYSERFRGFYRSSIVSQPKCHGFTCFVVSSFQIVIRNSLPGLRFVQSC